MLPGRLDRIGLDLMPAALAPDDRPQFGLRHIAERYRRAGLGFHCREAWQRRRAEGATLAELARSYHVSPATISRLTAF
jgi:hypothetical protein